MIALVDSLVIVLLVGIGLAAEPPAEGVPGILWLAFTTPWLVRTDLASRRLPNSATLTALALVVACSLCALARAIGAQDHGAGRHALAALVAVPTVLVGGWLVARTGALGLGDVKLGAALAGSLVLADADEGALALSTSALIAALVASLAGLAIVAGGRRRLGPRGVPFGPCLLLGYWSALAAAAVV